MATRTQRITAFRRRGLTRPQIADRLGISENLLGVYLHALLQKGVIAPITPKECRRRQRTASNKVNVRAARQMRLAGKSYRDIGRHYRVSAFTVAKVIGSTLRITQTQRQLISLHRQGLTYQAIAAQVGKPTGTVAVVLARLVRKGLLPKRSRCGRAVSEGPQSPP
jgi:transposase